MLHLPPPAAQGPLGSSRSPALALVPLLAAAVMAMGGCLLEPNEGGSEGLGGTTASPSSSSSAGAATSGTGGQGPSDGGTQGSVGGSTGGFCFPNGVFVGGTDPSLCCSDELSGGGYCGADGGTSADCPADCDRAGFHCESGKCVLNGDDGALQFTLNWENTPRLPEDLDLHVVEPSGCEIYWGNRQCFGELDLDANAGCSNTDPDGGFGSDIENVIYPPGKRPPAGTYIVRVDLWQDCTGAPKIPFSVTARVGDAGYTVHDYFLASDADHGGQGSGRTEITFAYP